MIPSLSRNIWVNSGFMMGYNGWIFPWPIGLNIGKYCCSHDPMMMGLLCILGKPH